MKINKITKYGKVPLDREILILKKNKWGVGQFYKASSCIRCFFYSRGDVSMTKPKTEFRAWAEFPKTNI
jgi:hypothetical protein